MPTLIDTHTHLYLKEFEKDRKEVIEQAIQLGVTRFFLPNIDRSSITDLHTLAKQYPENCYPMMGLHPCAVTDTYEDELQAIEQELKENKVYAVGEIGIDLYWDKTFFRQQQDAFRRQIHLAKQYELPIVIHSRNSFEEVMELLLELNDEHLKGIFHCFSGTQEQAEKVIALGGFKLGIGGVVTYKNSGLDQVVKAIDLQHLVLETDAPYLSPVPHRGKRNESAYLLIVAQKIAEIKALPLTEIAAITTANALEVFGIKISSS